MDTITQIFEDSMRDVFWPNFLAIILPVVMLIFFFMAVRFLAARLLRRSKTMRYLVDTLIVFVFLLCCAYVVPRSISSMKLPEPTIPVNASAYNPFKVPSAVETESSSEYEFQNPFEREPVFESGYEFHDPFSRPADS